MVENPQRGSSRDLVVIVLGLGIEAIAIILGIKVDDMAWWIASIGLILGGFCILWGVTHLLGLNSMRWTIRRVDGGSQPHLENPIADNEPFKLHGFEFYPSRDALRLHRPLLKQLASADMVWALWNTGTQARTDNAVERANIQRLILPHPDSPYLALLAQTILYDNVKALRSDILGITKQMLSERQAQERLGEVGERRLPETRWYRGLIGNTITIGNPLHQNPYSWIILETHVPMTSAPDRPSFVVWRQPLETLFNSLFQAYLELWNTSEEPNIGGY